jgi:adenine-specific DNA-methyltransferase
MFNDEYRISEKFAENEKVVLYHGNCLDLLASIPDKSIQLIVTSPPYNIGKEYEKQLKIEDYIDQQKQVIRECGRVLKDEGSICWQVGNYVQKGEIIPLDILIYDIFRDMQFSLRNRIIWHFEHGLHCKKRFSGRYETINWFTRKNKQYYFDLDPVRIPQKYPNKKHFKGPNTGKLSCNPLGKNPGDVWDIPNVKSNHVEKTDHPCQFPVGMIERLILSMTRERDWVLDPFLGSGTAIISAIKNNRRGVGAEVIKEYVDISKKRIYQAWEGTLKTRPMDKPVYQPKSSDFQQQISLFEKVRSWKL